MRLRVECSLSEDLPLIRFLMTIDTDNSTKVRDIMPGCLERLSTTTNKQHTSEDFEITLDGFVILPSEPIAVLKDEDRIQLRPCTSRKRLIESVPETRKRINLGSDGHPIDKLSNLSHGGDAAHINRVTEHFGSSSVQPSCIFPPLSSTAPRTEEGIQPTLYESSPPTSHASGAGFHGEAECGDTTSSSLSSSSISSRFSSSAVSCKSSYSTESIGSPSRNGHRFQPAADSNVTNPPTTHSSVNVHVATKNSVQQQNAHENSDGLVFRKQAVPLVHETDRVYSSPPASSEHQAANSGPQRHRKRIRRQLDFYFSNENYPTDFFLQSQEDVYGWIPIELVASFNKIKRFLRDAVGEGVTSHLQQLDYIRECARDLHYVEVSEDGSHLRHVRGKKQQAREQDDMVVEPSSHVSLMNNAQASKGLEPSPKEDCVAMGTTECITENTQIKPDEHIEGTKRASESNRITSVGRISSMTACLTSLRHQNQLDAART